MKITPLNAFYVREYMPTDESTVMLWLPRSGGKDGHFRRLLKAGWLEIVPRTTDTLRYTEAGKAGLAAMGAFSNAPRSWKARGEKPKKIVLRYGRLVKA